MKTQKLLKRRPKSGAPITVKTMKGGCRYFSVFLCAMDGRLYLEPSFPVRGKPFRDRVGALRISVYIDDNILLGGFGIIPQKEYLRRVFLLNEKNRAYYRDIVWRQDVEAFKEAIKATL